MAQLLPSLHLAQESTVPWVLFACEMLSPESRRSSSYGTWLCRETALVGRDGSTRHQHLTWVCQPGQAWVHHMFPSPATLRRSLPLLVSGHSETLFQVLDYFQPLQEDLARKVTLFSTEKHGHPDSLCREVPCPPH